MGESEDGEPGVKSTIVKDVFTPHKRLCFLFDYGDDWHFIVTCNSVDEAPTKRKIAKVLSRQGTPPEQYPAYEG